MKGRHIKYISALTLFLFSTVFPFAFAGKINQAQKKFIETIHQKYHIPKNYITALFEKSQFDPLVIKKISYPYEKKPWDIYKTYFVTKKRAAEGAAFWKKHRKVLAQIQKKYGIPASIIVAALGVETNYGTNIGTFSAFNSLNTLTFHYSKRQRFFRRELGELILLAHQEKMDPLAMKSSYAGAIGIPQFMPSTYRYYAVNFDDTNKIDLLTNFDDAMASVANYFKKHGWKTGEPVATSFDTPHAIKKAWISNRAIPKTPVHTWEQRGFKLTSKLSPSEKAALIQFNVSKGQKPIYWLTLHNFRVIMNYNPSTAYAMAVFQLSEKIKKDYERH